ncbi:MAG: FAD-dependent oxidoreductase [Clostridia bacterium]
MILETLETQVKGEYDVVVVGGGPAGVGAALAAARGGMRTLLIERFSCLGGMWTSGLVNPLFDFANKGGIVQEIVEGINALGMQSSSGKMYTFDMETMKVLLDRKMKEAGVTVLFHTYFARPLVKNGAMEGIVVENKGGRAAYLAKRVIDCTGDGDVAARAGAPFDMGREGDHACQPMTLMCKISQMDFVQQEDYPYGNRNELFDLMQRAAARAGKPDYDFNFEKPWLLRLPGLHTGVLQMTHMRNYNPLSPEDLSRAEMEGRERVQDAMAFFHQYMPQFANAQLDQTAAMIGVRESRRIRGEYTLTLEDVRTGRTFEDGFATCCFGVDIHQPDGKGQEKNDGCYRSRPYQLPYRALVPLAVEQLLVAGRCISGSFEAHASYRVTGDCVAMGQTAGIAAALSIRQGCTPRMLSGQTVVQSMIAAGAHVR